MPIKDVLFDLSALSGPSGFEGPVRDRFAELLSPLVDEVKRDAIGNVFGFRRAKQPDAKTLYLVAHLDEIGLIVTKVEEGFLRFSTIGGVDSRILPGREVTVLADPPIPGVVTSIPPHLQTRDEMERPMDRADLSIDIGLSADEAKARVRIGTPVVFSERPVELSKGVFSGKAFDDRACAVLLLRTLEMLKGEKLPVNLVVSGSMQEELGSRGAHVGVFRVRPDMAIAVDVTHGESPGAPRDKTFPLGSGAAISLGPNTNRAIATRLIELAKAKDIGFELEVMEGSTGTDAWCMQVSREGVATAILSVPLRYMHTAIEVVRESDIESGARLLAEFARSLERGLSRGF
ncbi:M20/M25/M40 family metallo-hydrolase [Oscillospiraceae bacterium OttesenSCG-928-G22]|nr:M20/M25/M40 family metallo-hydrolase [Oscillospiraceae bacterium OttesenSCG-928-G22]